MPKMMTPAQQKFAKQAAKAKKSTRKTAKRGAAFGEVWKRLRRNKLAMAGLVVFCLLVLIALFPGVFATHDPIEQRPMEALSGPSAEHWFGTDNFGRDIFSRVIYGTRVSLGIGLSGVIFALIVGGTLGAAAAFYGGHSDNIIMRVMDVLQSIPSILLALSIAAALGKGVFNLILAMGVSSIPLFARVVRAAVLTVKDREYVEAGKCIGATDARLIFRHMIPNAMGPIMVQATFGVASSILMIAGLSYIGLGIAPPTPEWGSMLSDAKQFMQLYWHVMVFPGVALIISSFSLNVLGDGLRDAFDPKLK